MNLSEIDYGTIGEDELYKEILLNSGVDYFFINTPYTYACLQEKLKSAMSQNGLEQITSEEDANRLENYIKENWIIKDNKIISQYQVKLADNETNLYATNIQPYGLNQIERLPDNRIKNSYLNYILQSEFATEAQKFGFEDMPQILENDNRIDEKLTEYVMDIAEDKTATRVSETTKCKISTLDKETFAELQQNIQNKDWEEALNLPDEYYTRVNKTTENSNTSKLEDLEVEPEEVERRQYTDAEFSQMAQRVMSNSGTQVIEIQKGDTLSELAQKYGTTVDNLAKMNNIQNPDLIYAGNSLTITAQREEIIKQALLELGLSERMYEIGKDDIKRMADKSIQNNDQIGELINQEQIEQLLRQLNKDIVIKDEYILGKADISDDVKKQYSENLGLKPEEYKRKDVYELYIDKENGLYHRNNIINSNVGTDIIETTSRIKEDNQLDNLSRIQKWNSVPQEEYKQRQVSDLDLSTALGIKNKPNGEWENITTTTYMPDICIENIREEGRRLQEEKAAATPNQEDEVAIEIANGIDSTGDNSNQHTAGFEEASGEITETELAEATEAILSRNGTTENGTISVIVGNSKKITISVEPYIQGDAESENARAANEEERRGQAEQTQTEDITK